MSRPAAPKANSPAARSAQGTPVSTERHPVAQLLARYLRVLAHAWRTRAALAGPARLTDETAFLPAALCLQHTPPHPLPRRLAFTLIALTGIALAWAWWGQVDVVAVAHGRIIIAERSKLVQPLERSVVKRVLVRDGDRVHAGQPLVELDPTSIAADIDALGQQRQASMSEKLRAIGLLQALQSRKAVPVVLFPADWSPSGRDAAIIRIDLEWNDIKSRMARLMAETARRRAELATAREMLAKLEATLPLSRQREFDIQALARQGFVASHAGQDRARERIELEQDLATQHARVQEALAALAESENGGTAYVAETQRVMSERATQAELKILQIDLELAKATQRRKLAILTAPASGTVQQLAAHTAGGVVTEAQVLMVIVPDSAAGEQLVAEVVLENKDIGFVRVGQDAEVKLETFPFTRYGTLAASVQVVSADAVPDEKRGANYPARLLLRANRFTVDGKVVNLSPGMNLTAEIKTGQRRVLDYLLSPVQRTISESMRER